MGSSSHPLSHWRWRSPFTIPVRVHFISHVPACMTRSSARPRAHHAFLRAHLSLSCVASCAVLTMTGHAREFQPCVYGVSTPTSGLMNVRGRDFRVVAILCRPYHWCHCEKTASLSGTSSRPHCLHSTLPAHNDEACSSRHGCYPQIFWPSVHCHLH